MIPTPCPYCQHSGMPEPPDTPHPHGACPACGRKSRAAITHRADGTRGVRYVAERVGRDMVRISAFIPRADAEWLQSLPGGYAETVRHAIAQERARQNA